MRQNEYLWSKGLNSPAKLRIAPITTGLQALHSLRDRLHISVD